MKYCLIVLLAAITCLPTHAQTYVFAQLNGSPVNTAGWNLAGSATVANVTGTGNSEILLCPATNFLSGAVFYNQPINLAICNKWSAEFDFRIFDGTGADGIAFCFLDVPPTGFVVGGGLGIPATANGLKVCFDTYLNCAASGSFVPKLEIRWGVGYDECGSPTINNATGALSIIRANSYCHAKISYNNGLIQVYLNNTLFMSANQTFNFSGYPGFTASTGGSTDNHSIKNVVIYTDTPPSEAGANQTVCSGQTVQLGTTPDPNNVYSWAPSTNLSSAYVADPTLTASNTTGNPVTTKYFVSTAFAGSTGCASVDSVLITVLPVASVSVAAGSTSVCAGTNASFTATVTNGGANPEIQWMVNGAAAGPPGPGLNFSSTTLANGDVVSCVVNPTAQCPATSNSIAMTVLTPVAPTISISATSTTVCFGTTVSFAAAVNNEGTAPVYQWQKNGIPVGTNMPTYTDNNLQNGDVITCILTSSASCVSPLTATSNTVTMTVTGSVTATITITPSANNVCTNTPISFSAVSTNGGTAPSYQWTINGVNAGTNSTSFSPATLSNNDVVQCILTSNSVCATSPTATSNTVVMNLAPIVTPTVTINTSNAAICLGDVASFTASFTNGGPSPSFQWKKNGVNVGNNSNTYSDNTVVAGDIISCVMTSNANCLSNAIATSNNLTVAIYPNPQVSLDHNPSLCAGTTRILDAGSFSSYLWEDGATGKTRSVNNIGTYWVVVTDAHGCKDSDTVRITTLLPSPTNFLPRDSAICTYEHFLLTANGSFQTYLWNSNSTAPQITVNGPGQYWLQVSTSNNCVGRDTVIFTAKDCGNHIYYPTAFTPNGDGKNDVFKPLLFNHVNEYEFTVYNRWGQVIFTTKTPGKAWDGTVAGKKQGTETFVWICTYRFDGENKKTDKGTITLIR